MRSSTASECSMNSSLRSNNRRSTMRHSTGSISGGMDVSQRLIDQLTKSQRHLLQVPLGASVRSSQGSAASAGSNISPNASDSLGALDASTSLEFGLLPEEPPFQDEHSCSDHSMQRSSGGTPRRRSLSLSLTLDKIEEGLVAEERSRQFANSIGSSCSQSSQSQSQSQASSTINSNTNNKIKQDQEQFKQEPEQEQHQETLVPLWRNPHLCMVLLVWLALACAVIVPTHFLLQQQQQHYVMDTQTQTEFLHAQTQTQTQTQTQAPSTSSFNSRTNILQEHSSNDNDNDNDNADPIHALLAQSFHHASSQTLQTAVTELQRLSLEMTYFAEATNTQWPLVPPNTYFQTVAQMTTNSKSNINTNNSPLTAIGFAPIVRNQQQRNQWENMTLARTDVARANTIYTFQNDNENDQDDPRLVSQKGPPPFAPLWHLAGSQQRDDGDARVHQDIPVNWDVLSHPVFARQWQQLQLLQNQTSTNIPVVMSDIVRANELPWEKHDNDSAGWKTIITLPVWDAQQSQPRVMRGVVFGVVSWGKLLLQQSGLISQLARAVAPSKSNNAWYTAALISNTCSSGSPVEITVGTIEEPSMTDRIMSMEKWLWTDPSLDAEELQDDFDNINATSTETCHYRMSVQTATSKNERNVDAQVSTLEPEPLTNMTTKTFPPGTMATNESYQYSNNDNNNEEEEQTGTSDGSMSAAIWWPLVMAGMFLVTGAIVFAIFVTVVLLHQPEEDSSMNENQSNSQASPAIEGDQDTHDAFSFYEIECNVLETKGKVEDDDELTQTGPYFGGSRKTQILSFIEEVNRMAINNPIGLLTSKPLADIFLNTTIMYGDISMFTAWSSTRDPTEIFRLLEVIYQAFNEIAVASDILTLDAIGDCYVACAGISTEKQQHAIKMANFSLQAVTVMKKVTSALEITFGPDTSKLDLRVGLNSGPVTLGVLRCAGRSRLQLFGHNVDLAAKMESTGQAGRVHISPETQKLLEMAGKSNACIPRKEKVKLQEYDQPCQTYWLVDQSLESSTHAVQARGVAQTITVKSVNTFLNAAGSFMQDVSQDEQDVDNVFRGDHRRLIDWNVDRLLEVLKKLVAKRRSLGLRTHASGDMQTMERLSDNATVMDAVQEVMDLPEYWANDEATDFEAIEINADVVTELYELVTIISTLYRKNPFHNFEHASHVVQSVIKLNTRIASQDGLWDDTMPDEPYSKENSFSYIASDPLVQLAFIFSALIHDLDHTGVSNDQLVKEGARIARIYKNESVAEQNSYDVAIDLLMEPMYSSLRRLIFATEGEMQFFLQLTKQAVIATDIMNKNLKDLRNARWEKAFAKPEEEKYPEKEEHPRLEVNRKATIFIEHLIQASDVSHTMQHWHIFRKWNQNLFEEMYEAYKEGRASKDPSTFWYKGEIGFFDFYIIPLAKKLKDCGVFGVYSDEYLNNAIRNRNEWELKGQDIVAHMIMECQRRQMAQAQKTLSEARALLQETRQASSGRTSATSLSSSGDHVVEQGAQTQLPTG
ncbi:calmodulin-dependent 3',5'-cyclic nucleotide phosphodiesterase 1A [Seminavis robusta]|uniref:Calmodulin-dependent 3',5'-cyclic nucleotide phosphodiesterase 1A n=1 Tax=Seminavis robusta TaxID=568900 RepID=A0A9N8DG72_9STRA|nr:calmodulin-dependent 3',5'-cyclic nucleotide phosphodiesterase 1A [Seminavis robusta]|eukprot:Sro53_g031300.1 calmodulin-dependent 3',5'-cyclic nucleotide phosphodiesterase 1A (1504) ;mRNA; r:20932-26712